MAYSIKKLLDEVADDVYENWRLEYINEIPKYIEAAKTGAWDDRLLDSFLTDNPVSNIAIWKGKFSEEEIDCLKANLSEISPILKEIADNEGEPDYNLYALLLDTIIRFERENGHVERRFSAMHRMVAALQPEILCSIVNRSMMSNLCRLISRYTDANVDLGGNYFEQSAKAYKLIKTVTGKSWEEIPTYAWQLYETLQYKMKDYNNLKESNREILILLEENKQIILQGAPGTGKTYKTMELALLMCEAPEDAFESREAMVKEYRKLTKSNRIFFTTFHQSMDYEDFVEGFKPDAANGAITYSLVPGIFKKACEEAASNPDDNFVLIIDEINRGNISKIFGELITLLEKDKRGDRLTATLAYSKKPFSVPDNLYIIGTMNTTDRSTGTIDYALRRRFAFYTLVADEKIILDLNENAAVRAKAKADFERVKKFLENESTEDMNDLMVGHSYFLAASEQELNRKWLYGVLPLLDEYYRDGLTRQPFKEWEKTNA